MEADTADVVYQGLQNLLAAVPEYAEAVHDEVPEPLRLVNLQKKLPTLRNDFARYEGAARMRIEYEDGQGTKWQAKAEIKRVPLDSE